MAADWYCELDGNKRGPITAAQLKQLAVEGKLQPADPVWKKGMQKKVQAHTVKGLFDVPTAEAAHVPGAALQRAKSAPKQEDELEFEMVEPIEEIEEIEEAEVVEGEEFELVSPAVAPKKDKDRGKKVAVSTAPKGAPTGGKPFRIMSGGRIRGPYTLQEIRNFLAAGKLGDSDLIGVETWLPAATLAGLVKAGTGAGKSGSTAAKPAEEAEEEEEAADFEVVEEEDTEQTKAPASRSDSSIPVDDDFHLS